MAPKRRRSGRLRRFALVVLAAVGAGLLAIVLWEAIGIRMHALRDPKASRTIEVPLPDGKMRDLVVGPQSPQWAPLGRISRYVPLCVVLAEDGRFWQHAGFDWFEIREAFERNLEKGKYSRGGSTITMQLAKNLFLWRDKSLLRKALELYLTVRLEQSLEKRRILELYLNVVEWGPGIYGIGEASRRYFGKSPAELTLGEAALLAVSLPSPRRSNPGRVTPYLQRRQQELLGRVYRSEGLGDLR